MRHQQIFELGSAKLFSRASTGFLRVVLLFGSVLVALALILIPRLADPSDTQLTGSLYRESPDHMVTGSVHAQPVEQASKENAALIR